MSSMAKSGRRRPLLELRAARELVLGACPRLASVQVPLGGSLGCVLAEDAVAIDPVPPFPNSAMDGYALRSSDTQNPPVTLTVVGTTHAGDEAAGELSPGTAQRVMTGAPLPVGTDAVCMLELTRQSRPGEVEVTVALQPGEHVREPGEDVAAGEPCFRAGTALSPAHLGVLISAGLGTVVVFPRPRVGVLSTGDELLDAGVPLSPGKIRDSNRPTLIARLETDGFEPVDLGSSGDDLDALARTIERSSQRADAVITIGGVSVGDHDFLAQSLEKLGASPMASLQLAIRPAKPFAFGVLPGAGVPVFGLPGNPVSALVSYELIVRPALRSMAGHRVIDRPVVSAVASAGISRAPDGKTHFTRVDLTRRDDGVLETASIPRQGSHQLRGFADASGLAVLADGEGVPVGGKVDVILLRDDALVPRKDGAWMP